MKLIACISAGAIVGALSRHFMMSWAARLFGTSFPWGTLLINILGSLIMGLLIELMALKFSLSQEIRAFLTVGILGSFTTFSTFSLDTVLLLQKGQMAEAFLYILFSVVISIAALFAGLYLVRLVVSP